MPLNVVIGCGMAGTHIVNALVQQGHKVRAVDFNDPAKYADKFQQSDLLDLVQGDATDAGSAAHLLNGAENVVLAFQGQNWNSSGKVDHGGVKTVAEAAATAGVKRVLLISSLMVTTQHKKHPLRIMLNAIRWKMMDNKLKGEERLRESGVPYTIVRPGRFVDKQEGAPAKLKAGQGDTITGSIWPADVAAVCVAALRDPSLAGVTFEVVDEWAKAPEDKTAPGNDGAPAGAEGGTSQATTQPSDGDPSAAAAAAQSRSVEAQLAALFQGLQPDDAALAVTADLQATSLTDTAAPPS